MYDIHTVAMDTFYLLIGGSKSWSILGWLHNGCLDQGGLGVLDGKSILCFEGRGGILCDGVWHTVIVRVLEGFWLSGG